MKKSFLITLLMLFSVPVISMADAIPNQPAPDFEAKGADGKTYKLADAKGKWLVLEWFNKDCPYVKKHYGSGNMQKLQKTYTDKGVMWLAVNSSAKGKEGNLSAAETLKFMKTNNSAAVTTLLDESGTIGKAYGAKTTPHMFIIDPKGSVVYAGGIDDNDSANPKVIPASKNYVAVALNAALMGNKIETASARPYGCSVKYE